VALNHFTVPVAISFSPWQFYELHRRARALVAAIHDD